ncbi:MAG: macro domain-containing protein, partial [Bryobacteraceae bacterium]
LPAKWVFHAVGPVYRDGLHGEPELLASCYSTCLRLAEEHRALHITFPSISTGVYGYPIADAARIALRTVVAHLEMPNTSVSCIEFVLFGRTAYDVYAAELAALP